MKKLKNIVKKHRSKLLALHIYISLFFIPLALMYKITGIVCIFGYFGGVDRQVVVLDELQRAYLQGFDFPLGIQSEPSQRESARAQILALLAQSQNINQNLAIPFNTQIKDSRDKNSFILGGTNHSIEIAKSNPSEIIIYRNDFLANLMALHFNRAGFWFGALSFCFVVFMGITYITGLLMCDFKRNGKKYTLTMLLGFVISATLGVYGLV